MIYIERLSLLETTLPKSLTQEEFIFHIKQYKKGNIDSKNILILHNIRLVIKVINKYDNLPYEKEDLLSIGIIGLIKALDNFDINREMKFSSLATACINNEIISFLRKEKRKILSISLDQKISIDSDKTINDIIKDKNIDIENDYLKNEETNILLNLINNLTEREKNIIYLKFGFIDGICYTQKEIADKLKMSRANVSRIINECKNKIRKAYNKKYNEKSKLLKKWKSDC